LNTHPLDPPHDFSRIPSLATARLGFAGPSPSRAAHSTYTEQSYTASFPTQDAVQTGVGAMYKSSRASAQAASERCAALFAPPPCTEAPRHASPTPWAACAQRASPSRGCSGRSSPAHTGSFTSVDLLPLASGARRGQLPTRRPSRAARRPHCGPGGRLTTRQPWPRAFCDRRGAWLAPFPWPLPSRAASTRASCRGDVRRPRRHHCGWPRAAPRLGLAHRRPTRCGACA